MNAYIYKVYQRPMEQSLRNIQVKLLLQIESFA